MYEARKREADMAKVELKQPIVDEIASNLEGAVGVVLAEYRGLTVEQDTELRRKFEALAGDLTGPTAIAISTTDASAPARILADFAKSAEALVLKAGVVEGTYYDVDGIKEIATIPSRDVLLSRLLGSMQSPITNFARVVKQIAEKGGDVEAAPVAEETATEE